MTVIDIGCGKGRFTKLLLQDGSTHVTAMDVSDVLFHYLPQNCEKIIGNILSIPACDNTYDMILCSETLEHAINIEAAIKEMVRVCKPGGYLVIFDKNLARPKMKLEAWEQWFDEQKLTALMESNGLIVETKEIPTSDGPPMYSWTGRKSA